MAPIYYLAVSGGQAPAQFSWVLCLGSHQAIGKGLAPLLSHLRTELAKNPQEAHSGYWKDSFPLYEWELQLLTACWPLDSKGYTQFPTKQFTHGYVLPQGQKENFFL